MDTSIIVLICACSLGLLLVGALLSINILMYKNKNLKSNLELALHSGGSATSGCMTILGAAAVLLGFLLPWISCNLGYSASGRVNGLNLLLFLISAFLGGIGSLGPDNGRNFEPIGGSFTSILVVLIAIILVVLIPIMGIRIGKSGFDLAKLLVPTSASRFIRKELAKNIVFASVVGLIPLILYFSLLGMFYVDLGGLGNWGIGVKSADVGIWVTTSGFLLALMTGIALLIFVAFNEQLAHLREYNERQASQTAHSTENQSQKPRLISESQTGKSLTTQIDKEEWDVLRLVSRGYLESDIARELSMELVRVNQTIESLFRKFGAGDHEELIRKAKEKGYIRFEVDPS